MNKHAIDRGLHLGVECHKSNISGMVWLSLSHYTYGEGHVSFPGLILTATMLASIGERGWGSRVGMDILMY
jgi:hypothetical protein